MVSSLIIDGSCAKQPEFFDPITGKFNQNAYQQNRLAELKQMTTDQFAAQIKDEIARVTSWPVRPSRPA